MTKRDLPPTSRWADDDGSIDPAIKAAGTDPAALVAAIAHARLLVPVVSELDTEPVEDDHCASGGGEKRASAAMVTVATRDGRAAVPVFSSIQALQTWRVDARPFPVEGPRAAAAAIQESDALLVLDPGSETELLVPRPAVVALATGQSWVPSFESKEVAEAVARALGSVPAVVGHTLMQGVNAELRIEVNLKGGLDRPALIATGEHISAVLGASVVIAQKVDSVELSLVR